MDHVVIPLDGDHVRAAGDLVRGVAAAAGVTGAVEAFRAHVTLVAHWPEDPAAVHAAVEEVVAVTPPFFVHAHGFGFFTGSEPSELNLHVPVVRTATLDAFHRALCAALWQAGSEVASWCAPELWTPHLTLIDRGLEPASLGRGAAWLARRHHPSWRLPVDRVELTGGWAERDRPADTIRLDGRTRTP